MELLVPARCCGPVTSGNGGWVSGAVAGFLDVRPAAVTLRRPPPLDTPMAVQRSGDGVEVTVDGLLVAEAAPGSFEQAPPPFVPPPAAEDAARHYAGFVHHDFPHCLTCGPARAVGDGLRIFPGGVVDGDGIVAAPFRAGALPDAEHGALPEPVVWAALDCPTGWPCIAAAEQPMLLARLTAEVVAPHGVPAADLVAVGAERWSEGRKHAGASALYDAEGTLLARAEALWIELR